MRSRLPVALALPLAFAAAAGAQPAARPNIVYIMSDDHAYQAISAYGSPLSKLAPTPNIDRIAKNGAMFTQSFVGNSLCGPSRATLLTGRQSHAHGFTQNGQRFENNVWVWPRALSQAGYATAMFGKWHINHSPEGIGFDDWKVLDDQGEYYNPDIITPKGRSVVEGYATDLITRYSLDWLKNGRDKSKPFAILIHHKAPHRNFMPALRHVQKYQGVTFPVPDNYFDEYRGRIAAGTQEMNIYRDMYEGHDLKMTVAKGSAQLRYNRWPGAFDRMTHAQQAEWDALMQADNDRLNATPLSGRDLALWKYQRYMQQYLGTIAAVDEGVGAVLDYLEESGLDRNTIVVYTSDQGFYLGEHGWFDKRFIYEESMRTPFLIQYPGHIRPGTRIAAPIQNIDYAPTFLDYAGVKGPATIQGRSMTPLLTGRTPRDWRKDLYYHYYEFPGFHSVRAHYGVRGERYKLVRFYGDGLDAWEFYDLKTDPREMDNRIADPAMKAPIARMKRRLVELRREYEDTSGPAIR
ncbi:MULTISPECIES: sulfatase [Sphingopyxis]|uniref:sulfatase family protein n=1 Tax=Sphingopyxis TaxID=165697 RepID=UPI0015CA3094|nr:MULTISPECIES: sulfatase [Sphingopyxis]NYF33424.1 arylsulfatase A-like enzyme [Sphingopyxis sp. JAI108]